MALALLVGPPIYLAYKPQAFTPLLDTLFSVFLFFLAFWIGRGIEAREARQQANDRWLPQAEAVTYRLMTLFTNVRNFSETMKSGCGRASCELPELNEDRLRAVRIKMKIECDASGQRLDDIANQLEDAIGDWQRFIAANCKGEECGRIFSALQARWQRVSRHEAALAIKTVGASAGISPPGGTVNAPKGACRPSTPVLDPAALGGHPFPGADRGQGPDYGDQVAVALRLHLQYGEPVVVV